MKPGFVLATVVAAAAALAAQAVPLQKAVALAPATIYLSPDTSSAKVGALRPGMDVAVQSQSGNFVQVFTGVSGWMPNHGYAVLSDPDAPEAIFGAAVQLEDQAENAGGENQAAMDAARLYLSIYSNLPASARAAEALYRGAEIHWELKMAGEPQRRTPTERLFPDDSEMHRVISKYGDSPWAARAAYQLLVEHFTCGDWTDKPECVEKEIHTYQDYIKKYPTGPMTAEATYDALYRAGIAWTLYRAAGPHADAGKASTYARQVTDGAAAMAHQFPETDWTARAALLAFQVAHNTPLDVPGVTPLGGP